MRNLYTGLILLLFITSCCINKNDPISEDFENTDSVYKLNETFELTLDKNLSGGYEWIMNKNDFVSLLEERDSVYQKDSLSLAEHSKIFVVRADSIGETTLYFSKKRSFEPDSLAIINAYSQKITIK